MKFKIAICDDEQNQIDYMAARYARLHLPKLFYLNMKKIRHLTFFCLILKWKI